MHLVNLDTLWQPSILRGRDVALLPHEPDDPALGLWHACSQRDPAVRYAVRLWQGGDGLEGSCTCPAGRHERPCKHLGAALLATGRARWWTEIAARRDRDGRPQVWLVGPSARAELLPHLREIEWGYGGAGPWWLATRLVARLWPNHPERSPLAVRLKDDFLASAPWEGWRLSAHGLDQWLARETAATADRRVPA